MLGRKEFTPKRGYQFSLEEAVPREHLLRRVAAAVDFAFVRRLTARFYSPTGKPGIDPVVLFKMALLGYLYGITSERRLAEEVRLHLAYRWFLGYDLDERPPDHAVLSKARKRFGLTVYLAFFTDVVRQCQRAGLVHGDVLYVDSTLVAANASRESAAARALVAQLPEASDRTRPLSAVEAYLDDLWRENPDHSPATPPLSATPAASAATPASAAPATSVADPRAAEVVADQGTAGAPPRPTLHVAGPEDAPNDPPGRVNELVVSRTDPDAGLVKREGVPSGFYHKAHVGVDGGRARIITATRSPRGRSPTSICWTGC